MLNFEDFFEALPVKKKVVPLKVTATAKVAAKPAPKPPPVPAKAAPPKPVVKAAAPKPPVASAPKPVAKSGVSISARVSASGSASASAAKKPTPPKPTPAAPKTPKLPTMPKAPVKPATASVSGRVSGGISIAAKIAPKKPAISSPARPSSVSAKVGGAFKLPSMTAKPAIRSVSAIKPKITASIGGKVGGLTLAPAAGKMSFSPNISVAKTIRAALPNMQTTITGGNEEGLKAAVDATTNTIANLAIKPSKFVPKVITSQVAKKALEAATPIAKACGCNAKEVIAKTGEEMGKCGYPPNSAVKLLAGVHEMNATLERAAIKRLATHEHNTLTAKHAFEHKVLGYLARLAQCLEPCHPTRTKAFLKIYRNA